MRSKRVLSLVVSAALTLAMVATTSNASADPVAPTGTARPLATCDAPPSNADATPANRDAFVQEWMAHISDKAWFANFADLSTLPPDIAAEPAFSMGADTQAWLIACLVDQVLASIGKTPTGDDLQRLQLGLDLEIFGKSQIAQMRTDLNKKSAPAAATPPASTALTPGGMQSAENALATQGSLTPAALPKANVSTPVTTSSSDFFGNASSRLQQLAGASVPQPTTSKASTKSPATPAPATVNPNSLLSLLTGPGGVLNVPLVQLVLKEVQALLQQIAAIQQKLFTVPGVNVLASAFYRVCAESATQPLACSVYLPAGVPNLVDVNGDNFPDMSVNLSPLLNATSAGVDVSFTKLVASQPLPAHVFIVYDTPFVKKRIEFGFDGRASTLAQQTNTKVWVQNILKAASGDVDVNASITNRSPGSVESMTFAVKDLVGGSTGNPPTEANPMAGAVQFTPFPDTLTARAHLTHTAAQDEDTFNVTSTVPSRVDAVIDQDATTGSGSTAVQSHRQFTALIDQLPTSVNVDLVHQGALQTITYNASAPISHVHATDTATGDISKPTSYTQSQYDVQGVPSAVQVQLQGSQDIKYVASSAIPSAAFSTSTFANNVLQQQIAAQANQVPANIHVSNITDANQTKVTYDADSQLGSLGLSMYDLSPQQPTNKTNLVANVAGIPLHIEFTQSKAGVLDFLANTGIALIQASYSRMDGAILPLPGDHATVKKANDAIGADVQLSGFKSAHFDGTANTQVGLGLDPGGQAFNALADLVDTNSGLNVLAQAHVSQLPSSVAVTIDPGTGVVTYAADRIIPELDGSFLKRDTNTSAAFTLLGLPKNITLTFNTSGASPDITYAADSRLTSITGDYQKAPNDLSFHAQISDLPQYMRIHGQDPTVFDARTAATDPIGSSYLGQVAFAYATDGTYEYAPTTDDHVLLDTTGHQVHAELQYTGLQYLSADTTNQQLHAEVRNVNPRLIRAYVTTDNLTANAFIANVPADVRLDQVGNDIQYHASSAISEIYSNVHRANGDSAEVDVQGVPNFIDLTIDSANSRIGWTANAATASISAIAHLTTATTGTDRAFDGELTITSIPAHWFATYPNGNVDFEADAPGIGGIDAKVTNHGSYHTLTGDHLRAYYSNPSGNINTTGDLDASLHISNLTKAQFSKITDGNGGGFTADLNMGNHGQFNFAADVDLGSTVGHVTGNFTHLPSTIHLSSDGGRIQYNGNDNPDLTLSVAAGDPTALTNTPDPLNIHGVSVRDGASSTGKAVKANLYITGLPDHLDLNSPAGTYTVDNFHPTIDPLSVDAQLTTLASQPITLALSQNVGTASPVSFTFGPFLSSTSDDGTHSMSLNYTASRDLGSLTAEATYGNTDDAKLYISDIPGGTAPSISVNAAFGKAQKSVTLAMTHDISQITASYKHVGDINFGASVDLTTVPKTVNMLIGRASNSDPTTGKTISAPDFEYTADHAGLNITAYANASIFGNPVDLTAEAHLQVTNIGQHVTGALDGTTVHITSQPATTDFQLIAAGTVNISADLGFSAGPFVNTGTLTVNANIKQLTIGFSSPMGAPSTDLRLDLGITTGLSGNFSNFRLDEKSDTTVTVDDHFSFQVDLGPLGKPTIHIVDINNVPFHLGDVIAGWHLNSNRDGFISLFHASALVGHCDVGINYRPREEFDQTSLSVGPPPNDGTNPPAWLITPIPAINGVPILSDWELSIIAFFESPFGHSISPGVNCDWGP